MSDYSLRPPKAPLQTFAIIKPGFVPVPEYFIDEVVPELVKSGHGLFTIALYLWFTRTVHGIGQERISLSIRELAEEIGTSVTSTRRAIKCLQELELLEVTKLEVENNNEPGFSYRLLNRVSYKKVD